MDPRQQVRVPPVIKRPLGPSRAFNMLGAPSGIPFAGAMTTGDIDYLVKTAVGDDFTDQGSRLRENRNGRQQLQERLYSLQSLRLADRGSRRNLLTYQ